MTCDRCHQQHDPTRCTGHVHNDDGTLRPCKQRPIRGGRICASHGGAPGTPAWAKAQERLVTKVVTADAAAVLGHKALAGVADPIEAMSMALAEAIAVKDALAARVNALDNIRYQAGQGEQIRAEMTLFTLWMKTVVDIADKLAKHDLEGKRQAAAERYATEIVQLLMAVFTDLVLSEQQQERVGLVVAHHLGRVVAGQLEEGRNDGTR